MKKIFTLFSFAAILAGCSNNIVVDPQDAPFEAVQYSFRNPEHNSIAWCHQRGEETFAGEKDTLDFVMLPESVWSSYEKGRVKFSMFGSYDVKPEDKESVLFEIPVTEVFRTEKNGIISVVIDCSVFDNAFFAGKKSASTALYAKNPISEISSDFVKVIPAFKPSVVVFTKELEINVGTAKKIEFTTYPEDTYVSICYDPNIVSVDMDGTVIALAEGETDITIGVEGGDCADVHVTTRAVAPVDLSADGTANCYIVPNAGTYTFNASVKGNGPDEITGAVSAEVVWESLGSSVSPATGCIIDSASYQDGIVTLVTNPVYSEGNAVVAVKDESGKILWSWHIWATDYNPAVGFDTYVGHEDTVVMDRELGVLSHDAAAGKYANLPLYYQWGRKDPFTHPEVETTVACSSVVSGTNHGTEKYAAEHPNTYITGLLITGYDWMFAGRNNGLWSTEKTVNDPCPAGWKVADRNIWSGFPTGYTTDIYNATIPGWVFDSRYSAPDAWYFLSGCYDSQMKFSTSAQGIWSSDASDICAYYLGLGTDGQINVWNDRGRAYAMPVRCVADIPETPEIPEAR